MSRKRPLKRPQSRTRTAGGDLAGIKGFQALASDRPGPESAVLHQSSGTSSSATMLMILISGLIAGPAVSL